MRFTSAARTKDRDTVLSLGDSVRAAQPRAIRALWLRVLYLKYLFSEKRKEDELRLVTLNCNCKLTKTFSLETVSCLERSRDARGERWTAHRARGRSGEETREREPKITR